MIQPSNIIQRHINQIWVYNFSCNNLHEDHTKIATGFCSISHHCTKNNHNSNHYDDIHFQTLLQSLHSSPIALPILSAVSLPVQEPRNVHHGQPRHRHNARTHTHMYIQPKHKPLLSRTSSYYLTVLLPNAGSEMTPASYIPYTPTTHTFLIHSLYPSISSVSKTYTNTCISTDHFYNIHTSIITDRFFTAASTVILPMFLALLRNFFQKSDRRYETTLVSDMN